MNPVEHKANLPFAEFVALMATMMSLVALSIDAVLPALPAIGNNMQVNHPNDVQLVVGLIFLGMAIGQFFYGPISDAWGRKPVITLGIFIFMIGSVIVLVADNLQTVLVGRFIEGLGLGAPRVVCVALIRDIYTGDAMARVLSFVMTLFILVPMIAPLIGQGLLLVMGEWRAIFIAILSIALIVLIWFNLRQTETLPARHRRQLSVPLLVNALREIAASRVAVGFTLLSGLCSGVFLAYLSSAQQILGQLYGLGDLFPLVFAILSAAIGAASYINARIVLRFGMLRILNFSLSVIMVVSLLFLLVAVTYSGQPPIWSFLIYLALVLFCTGLLFGNANAMAMEPLGHIAGIGAAVVGSVSILISVPLGIIIARAYAQTIVPLLLGFLLAAVMSRLITAWAVKQSAGDK